mgnify:CR=1 FL=1|jgi:hypothetical protein|tara:strand:- start:116 stop:313 length:198 start_codon:yes stop_codon:yes gene_type:complete
MAAKGIFEVTYTWIGTLEVEAADEDAAVEQAWEGMMKHPAPMNLFDCQDDTMEVTDRLDEDELDE